MVKQFFQVVIPKRNLRYEVFMLQILKSLLIPFLQISQNVIKGGYLV
jgi:hypothetical protein